MSYKNEENTILVHCQTFYHIGQFHRCVEYELISGTAGILRNTLTVTLIDYALGKYVKNNLKAITHFCHYYYPIFVTIIIPSFTRPFAFANC